MEDHDAHTYGPQAMYLRMPGVSRLTYREYAAKGVLESLRKLGVCLLSCGPHIRAVPQARMRRYPGMVHMVQRYTPELRVMLDAEVE